MRITCPACSAAYDVPDARLAPGRNVRCARCGTDWSPVTEPPPAAPQARDSVPPSPPVPLPEPAPPMQAAPAAAPRVDLTPSAPPLFPRSPLPALDLKSRQAVAAGWAASLLLLAVLAWSAIAWRANVVRAWPPSERLYVAVGLLPRPAR